MSTDSTTWSHHWRWTPPTCGPPTNYNNRYGDVRACCAYTDPTSASWWGAFHTFIPHLLYFYQAAYYNFTVWGWAQVLRPDSTIDDEPLLPAAVYPKPQRLTRRPSKHVSPFKGDPMRTRVPMSKALAVRKKFLPSLKSLKYGLRPLLKFCIILQVTDDYLFPIPVRFSLAQGS